MPIAPIDHCRFQVRAAAIIIRDGALLIHRAAGDTFWALPGGRVEAHETAAQAIERELLEELGMRVTASTLLWIDENRFAHGGIDFHEIGCYFVCEAPPGSPMRSAHQLFDGIEAERRLTFA
jgi:8-oxo-dGTP pyrophosphatase MutT (NUDIX family)